MSKRVQHRGRVTVARDEPNWVARGAAHADVRQAARDGIARAHQRQVVDRIGQLLVVDPRVADALRGIGQHIVHEDSDDGECSHAFGSPIDMAPTGPEKVWRCDQCEWLYRLIDAGDGEPIMVGLT